MDLPAQPERIDGPMVSLRAYADVDLAAIEAASDDPLIPLITSVPSPFSLPTVTHSSNAITVAWPMAPAGRLPSQLDRLALRRAACGYWVVPSARGRGVATAALDLVNEQIGELLDLRRLTLFIDPRNTPSIRTAERCGFRREAVLEAWERVGDDQLDMAVYVRRLDRQGRVS